MQPHPRRNRLGIGQALLEETIRDRKGRLVNNNLSEYLVPVQGDVPPIEVSLINEIDGNVNPAGAKGLGELGICGAAAAVLMRSSTLRAGVSGIFP